MSTKFSASGTITDALAIHAREVTKRFGDTPAIEKLSLDVGVGECVGMLGPNGAGKSTFIGCLYGVVVRSGGALEVFGYDPAVEPRRIKQRLGVVPQENALDEELTVIENMRLYARFAGLSKAIALPRIDELLTNMSLDHK
ncbi:MAG TPA: ATP-binding cassette domain-containing protein, partial [Terrimicrobiaceae bacterium]